MVIAGGGMVGFALACALGHSPRLSEQRVLLLEASKAPPSPQFPSDWLTAPYTNRVSSIAHHSCRLLDSIGAWQDIEAVRTKVVTGMQVWESESDAYITFGDGQKPVAHIVENDLILEALKRNLPSSVEVRYSSSAERYTLPSGSQEQALLHMKDGSIVATRLLVGCDGAQSLVRKSMAANQYVAWDYQQKGVVATLQLEQEEGEKNNIAWQKFLPSGPIALLPLTNGLSSLVWSTTPSHAKTLIDMEPLQFTDALNRAIWSSSSSSHPAWLQDFQERCSGVIREAGRMVSSFQGAQPSVRLKRLPPSIVGVQEESRAAFPLGLGHAVHYTAPRVVLVGDAAHRVHPLAGQGVNLGFGDVTTLVEVLEEAVMTGADVGNELHLHNYQTIRQRQNVAMLAATDGLHRLYNTALPPVVLLRSLGLTTVDALAPIKRRIESYVEG